jgi:hypothetical protein
VTAAVATLKPEQRETELTQQLHINSIDYFLLNTNDVWQITTATRLFCLAFHGLYIIGINPWYFY